MSMFLPEEVRRGLDQARAKAARKSARLRVGAGPEAVPILAFGETEFAVDSRNAPSLRGFVDIYDGGRHLYHALIVTSREEGGRRIYEFKRMTQTADAPARDYVRGEDAPVALIPYARLA